MEELKATESTAPTTSVLEAYKIPKEGTLDGSNTIGFVKKEDKYYVKASGLQGSNILSSLAIANCYIKLGMDIENIKESEIVTTIPFEISHE